MTRRLALLSVWDKTGIVDLAMDLVRIGYEIVSTGGTARVLGDAGIDVIQVSELTQFPEILGGRVKTLHPRVYGGLLARREVDDHMTEMTEHDVAMIDLVAVNLYPFERVVGREGGVELDEALENIDIGGVSLLRASAKNFRDVLILSDPKLYGLVSGVNSSLSEIGVEMRRRLAVMAYQRTAEYDTHIAMYLGEGEKCGVTRHYEEWLPLKYGCNPHQTGARLLLPASGAGQRPFEILNGIPGYINIMDAVNAWKLVSEMSAALDGAASAASFKHVSPAGAAVGTVGLDDLTRRVYEIREDEELSELATAYIRARNADPMSSFGDFVALSHRVDVCTARLIKREVGDGVIAPDFDPEALEILRSKRGGRYLILRANVDFDWGSDDEMREFNGMVLAQPTRFPKVERSMFTGEIVGSEDSIPEDVIRDMIVATVTVKYTQSNSVVYAKDGQAIGVGAGQQSRVDCVKLAGRKVRTWWLRHHEKVLSMKFETGTKRQERVNARIDYIDDQMNLGRVGWSHGKEADHMILLNNVVLSSDAFFPFRDSLDVAAKYGVKWVVQPGGSLGDDSVKAACQEHDMTMSMTGLRLFHH